MRCLLYLAAIATALQFQTRLAPAQEGRAPGQDSKGPSDGESALSEEDIDDRQPASPDDDPQDVPDRKRLELLERQIETQQKMIDLLLEHAKQQPLAGSPVEKLQSRVATMEARTQQAARRDDDLGQAIDNLTEHLDAQERNGPRLPATLKEWFFPSRTNETPLSIYGSLIAGYELFPNQHGAGNFGFDGFEPIFLLQLNDHILLESELEFHLDGVEIGYAQMDYIVNDWLTAVGGRFLAPIGFFNERLHAGWINKLPDFPLAMRQVSLADFSLNGVQARGATYLFDSPVKAEYSLYAANGIGVPGAASFTSLADFGALKDTTKQTNNGIAWGGRLGLWVPDVGFNAGSSMFFNRPYGADAGPDMALWGLDAGYHLGNWDARFEFASTFQRNPVGLGFPASEIHRRGFYIQGAYRPYDASNRYLQNTEFVFRYSRARFNGIDPTTLDMTAFNSPLDAPVDRDQYTFGINYYFYASLILKFAYEINHERGINLKDNVFLTQLAWGF